MKIKIGLRMVFVFILLCVMPYSGLSFGQEEVASDPGKDAQGGLAIAEMQWLWGEVVSVEPDTNRMLVRFVDYDTSSEREIAVSVDAETKYEGVKSMYEIKPSDTVNIDYIITADGRSIARDVSVEVASEGQPQ